VRHTRAMTRTGALKVLIADDHAPMRQTLRALLALIASGIGEATDDAEAVDKDQHEAP
jgi:hypothetical protein